MRRISFDTARYILTGRTFRTTAEANAYLRACANVLGASAPRMSKAGLDRLGVLAKKDSKRP
jgi:hypothetical protein